jgi:monoamine oxidase
MCFLGTRVANYSVVPPSLFSTKYFLEVRMNSTTKSVTRRDFLYRAAMVGGSALLLNTMNAWGMGIASKAAAPPQLSGTGKGKKIVILGAGLAGMTAAFELSKLGYECQVLEARQFAGGRCQTARKGFKPPCITRACSTSRSR